MQNTLATCGNYLGFPAILVNLGESTRRAGKYRRRKGEEKEAVRRGSWRLQRWSKCKRRSLSRRRRSRKLGLCFLCFVRVSGGVEEDTPNFSISFLSSLSAARTLKMSYCEFHQKSTRCAGEGQKHPARVGCSFCGDSHE